MHRFFFHTFWTALCSLWLMVCPAAAQSWYSSSGGDLIFSTARGKVNGQSISGPLRFSAFLHMNNWYHYDFTNTVGIHTGWGIKNIGFIQEADGLRTKFRSYALTVPVGIKIGNMGHDSYVHLGAGVDLMFNYKEKTFRGDERIRRISSWFSNRTELFVPYVYAGYQFPYGLYLRGYYYLGQFLNTSFTTTIDGTTVRPYANSETHLIYLAVGFNIRNAKAKAQFRPSRR